MVYEAFAHDAQDLWKASYVRVLEVLGEGTERLENTDKHEQLLIVQPGE